MPPDKKWEKDSREIILVGYCAAMLEHYPEHLLHDQSHAADQALSEHEELFYVPPVIFIQGGTPAAGMAGGSCVPTGWLPKAAVRKYPWSQ